MPFAQHYQQTLEELARVCASCGRDPREVKVIAVSKTVDVPAISAAIAAGAHDFGENRPDVLAAKVAQLPEQTWHFIGNVQSRKIPGCGARVLRGSGRLARRVAQPASL